MTKNVLLCDDEFPILRAAEFRIKRAGYDVRTASDGEEALELIEAHVPDVLVTDCQMPRLDGWELVRRVRANPATAKLPVLMLTARGFDPDTEEFVEKWNVVELIAKPFSPRRLLQSVSRALGEEPASAAPGTS
jgi:CheY-like chemotaxis protein